MMAFSGPAERHQTIAVKVGNVAVGGGAPVVVQSMTNTDTADVEGTARQVAALARAGSELVRITVARGGGGLETEAQPGRPRRARRRRAAHQGAAPAHECRRPDRRRFPLYRPQAF